MSKSRPDMIKGTLDMLILKVLSLEPMHGWGISERIQRMSDDVLEVNQGSLYPALHRLARRGWIGSGWDVTENNRRAKYYRLTPAGEAALAKERDHWRELSWAVDRVMAAEGA